MAIATISEIEKKVGLDTYAVENEGIGGIIKVKISDFRVEALQIVIPLLSSTI